MAVYQIEQFQRNPKDIKYKPLDPPDGSPIGNYDSFLGSSEATNTVSNF